MEYKTSIYKGHKILQFQPNNSRPFGLGYGKLKTIIDNLDIVKQFVDTYKPPKNFDAERKAAQGLYNKKEINVQELMAKLQAIDAEEKQAVKELELELEVEVETIEA